MKVFKYMFHCVFYNRYCCSELFHYFLKFPFMKKKTIRKFPKLNSVPDFEIV